VLPGNIERTPAEHSKMPSACIDAATTTSKARQTRR